MQVWVSEVLWVWRCRAQELRLTSPGVSSARQSQGSTNIWGTQRCRVLPTVGRPTGAGDLPTSQRLSWTGGPPTFGEPSWASGPPTSEGPTWAGGLPTPGGPIRARDPPTSAGPSWAGDLLTSVGAWAPLSAAGTGGGREQQINQGKPDDAEEQIGGSEAEEPEAEGQDSVPAESITENNFEDEEMIEDDNLLQFSDTNKRLPGSDQTVSGQIDFFPNTDTFINWKKWWDTNNWANKIDSDWKNTDMKGVVGEKFLQMSRRMDNSLPGVSNLGFLSCPSSYFCL